MPELTWLQTIIIAIVEGLTEFLPVSSTGHMVITQKLLGVENTPFVNAFTVIIQFGAILSVVVLYWRRFFVLNPVEKKQSLVQSFLQRYAFYTKLFVAFLPAVGFGLLLHNQIEALLGSVRVVAIMLLLGGVFMLFIPQIFKQEADNKNVLNHKKSFVIGLFQCVAMIPGVSRSMATIVGGLSQKMTRKDAAEFSFFLAVPTMLGATCLELYKLVFKENAVGLLEEEHFAMLALGSAVAFVVALLAIKTFINFLTKYGFTAFGWYRIIVGLILVILLACGVDLQMVD